MSFIKKHFTLSLLFACLLSLLGGFTELYSIKTRGIYADANWKHHYNVYEFYRW